jgi:asparagine synthase (glutamine-hydrolysing)
VIPKVPVGGFLAAAGVDRREELVQTLQRAGAQAAALPGTGPVLAAWREYPGQGLWVGDGGAVAYDLDLANVAALRGLLGAACAEAPDPGELLWRLYRAFGQAFLDRLRGPFAFALWHAQEELLLVATDPFGIRPVVYAPSGGGLAAASRIGQVRRCPGVSEAIDPEALYHYLFYSAIPSPATIYRGIRKLEPGRFLAHTPRGTRLGTHYDLRYRPDGAPGESYWRRAIPLEVRGAVQRVAGLSAPESTGCFLSGGTDSSSVAGYYGPVAGAAAQTFSIGFDEPGYNELDYAHLAARHFGTRQHDYFVTPEDVLALVEALPRLYDEPFGNSSVIPAFYCARLAREQGIDVLLAGDGGDEIFGGNERYVTNLVFQRYQAVPALLRRGVLEPLLKAAPGWGPLHKAKRYVRRANIPNPDRFFSYNLLAEQDPARIFQPDFLEQVDPDCFLALARRHYEAAAPAHDTDRLLYLDMKFTITDNDLRKVTQMGEAAGVRVRYPFLDRDLVDFTCTIPPTLKVKPGRNRYIFKRAMEGFLPAQIIQKTKHGFGLPVGPWFRSHPGLSSLLADTLFSGAPRLTQWIRPEFLRFLRQGLEVDNVSYYGANLWVLLVLELWLRRSPEP